MFKGLCHDIGILGDIAGVQTHALQVIHLLQVSPSYCVKQIMNMLLLDCPMTELVVYRLFTLTRFQSVTMVTNCVSLLTICLNFWIPNREC